jgi:hypothetical protein
LKKNFSKEKQKIIAQPARPPAPPAAASRFPGAQPQAPQRPAAARFHSRAKNLNLIEKKFFEKK